MKPFLVLALAPLLAGCAGSARHAAPSPAQVKLVVTIQRAESLHNARAHYTLSCPAARGTFPDARAACTKLATISAMLHPPKMTATCLGGPGIPPEVDVKGTVDAEAIAFSLTSCQAPSARARAAREWLALAQPQSARQTASRDGSLPRKSVHGASPTPPNQPVLDKAAEEARAMVGPAYYTEAAINLGSNTVDLYLDHAPQSILERLQALHPGTYVVHDTSAHPRGALLRLEGAISVSYWSAHGVDISMIGPRRDGHLEIGVTSDVPTARSKLTSAYGASWVRVAHEDRASFLSASY